MQTWYPSALAEEWDRVGLVLGDPHAPVGRILLALDPVRCTADEAIGWGADLLIVHHPLYLRGTSFLPESDPKGGVVADLVRARIGLFTAHTNADAAPFGVAAALAELLGLADPRPLVPTGVELGGSPCGHGRIGTIDPMRAADFAGLVARRLPASPSGLLFGGDEDARVETVAVSGGAGDSFLAAARAAGADAFVTADLRHHPASEHLEAGAPVLLGASHWASESPWLPVLARRLRAAARERNVDVDVKVSTIATEPWTSHRPTEGGLS